MPLKPNVKKGASMNQTMVYVGLDVDDTQYHGSALNKRTGEIIDFKCRPTLKGLLGQLEKLRKHVPGCSLRLCYEASYIGHSLQRDLAEKGHHCSNSKCASEIGIAEAHGQGRDRER
jgi:hypothetical protein